MFAVTTKYSFDPTITSHYYGNREKALQAMRKDYEREFYIDTEENGWDTDCSLNMKRGTAQIINHFRDHDNTTDWAVSEIEFGDINLYSMIEVPVFMFAFIRDIKEKKCKIVISPNFIFAIGKSELCRESSEQILNKIDNEKFSIGSNFFFVLLVNEENEMRNCLVSASGEFVSAYQLADLGKWLTLKAYWSKEEAEEDLPQIKQDMEKLYPNWTFEIEK